MAMGCEANNSTVRNHAGIWRSALSGMMMVIAVSSLVRADDLFQSAPGPAPRPHTTRPAPRPEIVQPVAPPAAAPAAPAGIAVFDGKYKGTAPGVAQCGAHIYEVDVLQGTVVGRGTNGQTTFKVWGTISGDGFFTGMHGDSNVTGKFQNGTFEGTFLSVIPECGRRTLTLRRDASP